MKSDVKRKLVMGSIEVAIGIVVLIYSWVKDTPLLYMGLLLVGSGLFTLLICGLRILMDKKAKENEANAVNAENGQQSGKKSIGQTIYNAITLIVVFAVVVVAGIFVFKLIKGNDTPPPDTGSTPIIQLETPQEVSFDIESYILSWKAVENAGAYTIFYNGTETTVDTSDTYEQITLIAEENVFKVKAAGDGSYYSDSKWSKEVKYVMETQQEQSVFEKVNLKLAQAAQSESLTLEKIIGISYVSLEPNKYGDHVSFETICSKDGVSYNYELSFKNDGYTSSFEELFQHFESATYNSSYKNKIVDYDSARYLIEGGIYNPSSLDGKMEELRLQGYEITVISSAVREGEKVGSKFRFEIVGTYKAVLGSDVKYFTSTNKIDILQPSSNESYNYEGFLGYAEEEYSTVTERSYVEHEEGATWLYMEEWASKNDASSAA